MRKRAGEHGQEEKYRCQPLPGSLRMSAPTVAVIFAVTELAGAVSAAIYSPILGTYELATLPSGEIELREIAVKEQGPCGNAAIEGTSKKTHFAQPSMAKGIAKATEDAPAEIDVISSTPLPPSSARVASPHCSPRRSSASTSATPPMRTAASTRTLTSSTPKRSPTTRTASSRWISP